MAGEQHSPRAEASERSADATGDVLRRPLRTSAPPSDSVSERSSHYATAPGDRLSFVQKLLYGAGALANNLQAAAIGGMIIVLNLGLGMNPALVGLVGAIPRVVDAVTDPIMGFISDNTRSRWGRRRPYILLGALASGVVYALLWQIPEGRGETFYFWFFLIGSIVFYLAYTVFATPWVALGYELTPDYHERTRLMGVQNFIGQLAYLIAPWFLWFMTHKSWFKSMADGASVLAILIAVGVASLGILPALFLRERFHQVAGAEAASPPQGTTLGENVTAFLKGMVATLSSRPFLKLCAATFLVFNGFIMVSSFQSYVVIYYVCQGDQEAGARYSGYAGTLGSLSTFVVISLITWLGTRIGKRRAFYVSTGISMLGYGMKWFAYDPAWPLLVLLPAPFVAFGLGGLFTLMGSMMADVVDLDELESHQRREGMFGSIFWWVVKLGMAAALAAGGFLLNATGFDVALGANQSESTITLLRLCDAFIPMLTSGVALWAIATYPLTEEKAHQVRATLEARRGTGAVAS